MLGITVGHLKSLLASLLRVTFAAISPAFQLGVPRRAWIVFGLMLGAGVARADAPPKPAYLDPNLAFDERVRDLISRLTLDEKAGLMRNDSDGVARLGIPKYEWWNEALHGVARAGEATVFPQAIGLAAMWDEDGMRAIGDAIGTEARAKHHDAVRHGRHERYFGLTFWSPNINLFRDPRWGRGQETYGEDPWLTARTGVAFVRGLQGNDPKFLKAAACAKHYAVHSGPEPTRYHVNVKPDEADFHESYLPAFAALVREGQVESVMTAYNAVNGQPCTVNAELYGLLRAWGFQGHVVSDCGAVYTLFEQYGVARDFPEAEAMAVKAGLNLRCGSGGPQLAEAVRRGLLTEAQLDAGLAPLLRTMFRLGFFDDPDRVPFARIPLTENAAPGHAALALEAARKSIVLLKNDGTLPLRRDQLRRVLVVGPNAASIPVLLGNYHGTPRDPVAVLAGLRAALGPTVTVDYVRGCDYAGTKPGLTAIPRTALLYGDYRTADEGDYTGLWGDYFPNPRLEGMPGRAGRDHQVDFDWAKRPLGLSSVDQGFSVRWTGRLVGGTDGEYQLTLKGRGGMRLFLGDELAVDAWSPGEKSITVSRSLAAGVEVPVRLEYFSTDATGGISLQWNPPPANAGFARAVEQARAADAVIFVGGIYAQLEGEDMRVDYEGFAGGDRTRIELPEVQQELIAALAATGRPLVFVNCSGGAMAFPDVETKANAILQAWYPGQAGGTAIADVLLGRVNPAGRLPVTFYRATTDLPDFADYAMANRTYRYFRGQPLYAFGHGLSYTRFDYSDLQVTREATGELNVSVRITNVGPVEGDEVVQLYLQEPTATNPRARQTLSGFRRIPLAAGASRTVEFSLPSERFERWDRTQHAFAIPTGEWRVEVGASSSDIRQVAPAAIH